jgi:hypothetical protein
MNYGDEYDEYSGGIDLRTQLDCALRLMTKQQYSAWEAELHILQLQCTVRDAEGVIAMRDREIAKLEKQLKTAQTLLRGEKSE